MTTNNNNRELTNKEFYLEACRFADSKSAATAKKWWQAFVEVIVRQLYFNNSCSVPYLGVFGLKYLPQQTQTQKSPDGDGVVVYEVPERNIPIFSPNDSFVNDVNMIGVTKAFRKRQKKNKLTQRDHLRQQRSEMLGAEGSLSEAHLEAAKARFLETLKEKAANTKGKVIEDDDDED